MGRRLPAEEGFKQAPAGSSYSRSKRVTKGGPAPKQTHLNISSSPQNPAIDFISVGLSNDQEKSELTLVKNKIHWRK